MQLDLINRTATLGLFIGVKEYWNKGIGTDATRLILDFGFNVINLMNIWLYVFAFNENAKKVYEKCGFKEVGRRRKSIIIGDQAYDEIYMDIIQEDFKDSQIKKLV